MKFTVMMAWAGAVVTLAGTSVAASPAVAQQSAAAKVAYVNTREVLEAMPEYARAESTFNKEAEQAEQEMQRLQATLDSLAGDFERRSAMLSETQRTAQRQEIQDRGQKAFQREQELRKKMAERQRELLGPIQSRINSVIEGMRAEGGYAMIFDISAPNSPIVTADRSLDLTQRVVQRLKSSN